MPSMNHSSQLKYWIGTSRVRLTLLFGGLSTIIAVAVAAFITHERTQELTRINADALALTGRPIAASLAEGLREREREAVLLSHNPLLTLGALESTVIQSYFEEIQQSFPFYSWIGVTDEQGIVQVSTGELLHKKNVSHRPWYEQGLKGPYVGDAHEAIMLDQYLRTDKNSEPLRFLDFSSPVRAGDGKLRGVLAFHINWEWATQVIEDSLTGLPHSQGVEVLILDRNKKFLHPRGLLDSEKPLTDLPKYGEFSEVIWGKSGSYLTSTQALPGTTVQSLGWTIVVRQPMNIALAPIEHLHETMVKLSISIVLALMVLTYFIANRFSLPIERLERAARKIDETGKDSEFNIEAGTSEVVGLQNAMRRMTLHLLQGKRDLEQANAVLEQKVVERTAELAMRKLQYQEILQDQTEIICRFSADYKLTYVNDAFCRMFGLRSEDAIGSVWAPVVHPDDLDAVEKQLAAITIMYPIAQVENRVINGQGQIRWCHFVNRAYFDETSQIREWQSVGRDITNRKVLEGKLQKASEELQDLYDHAPCGYYSVDADGLIIKINDLALKWMGVKRNEVLHKSRLVDFLDQDGQSDYWSKFPIFLTQGSMGPMEFNLVSKDGVQRRIQLSATAVKGADGKFLRSRSIMFDITELHAARQQLGRLNAEQRAMLDNDLLGIAKLHERKIIWRNKALEHIFGYDGNELLGLDTSSLYPSEEAYQNLGKAAYPLLSSGQHFRQQTLMRKKDGTSIWLDISGVRLSEKTDESLWLLQDISEMKKYQTQVEHFAFHDPLTSLPNRLLLADRLKVSIAANERIGTITAVCYLDLDGFKPINDRHGHDAGDEVLKEVAKRLNSALRSHDTVARLGGDEFALLLTNLVTKDEVDTILKRIMLAVDQPIHLNSGSIVNVSTSIGVAFHPIDAIVPSELFTIADRNMYENKKNKKSNISNK